MFSGHTTALTTLNFFITECELKFYMDISNLLRHEIDALAHLLRQ